LWVVGRNKKVAAAGNKKRGRAVCIGETRPRAAREPWAKLNSRRSF
jgi:hypothetical protein